MDVTDNAPRLYWLGEGTLVLELAAPAQLSCQGKVWWLAQQLHSHEAIAAITTGMNNLSIQLTHRAALNPASAAALEEYVAALWPLAETLPSSGRVVEIPVQYGGEMGPDLAEVAQHCGLSIEAVIQQHSQALYTVFFMGFQPGFAYMGELPSALATPRRAEPRLAIPAGSVAIGGSQTGIYPALAPGGWQIIGRTSLKLFDPTREQPSLLQAGDQVRFIPCTSSISVGPAVARTTQATSDVVEGLEVLQAGIQTTVQDTGRDGYRQLGVCSAGAMDKLSMQLANLLVGNPHDAAVLEIVMPPVALRFQRAGYLALTGADCQARLDGQQLWSGRRIRVQAGQQLHLQAPLYGMRAYLAVDGGIAVPSVMASRSTDLQAGFGGHHGRALQNHDVLPLGPSTRLLNSTPAIRLPTFSHKLRVLTGPDYAQLTPAAQEHFWQGPWKLSPQSNRMGYRLTGPLLESQAQPNLLSHGVFPGLIQLPPGGKPIVLMADAQTTGGYPRLAVVIAADLWKLGQIRLGSSLQFVPCTLEEARAAWQQQQQYLQRMERTLNAD